MWSLELSYLKDVPWMGMVGKLKHFEWMCEGVQPDDIPFVCLCQLVAMHTLVCFNDQRLYDSCKMEHWTCMVDLLGRAGHLQEAENMVTEIPCKPQVATWMALLDTCRIHGNMEMAEHNAKWILEMEPENAASFVLLSNIYAGVGDIHLCENVEHQRKEKGAKKCSHLDWSE